MLEEIEQSNVSDEVVDDARGLMVSATELMHPLTGEVLDISSADGLIHAYQQLSDVDRLIYSAKIIIRTALKHMATEGGKTRRVAGDKHTAMLTMPDAKWDNTKLKELWQKFPSLREKYLRIDRLAPNLNEVKKLKATTCEGELANFRALLLAAESPADGLPSVKVEK